MKLPDDRATSCGLVLCIALTLLAVVDSVPARSSIVPLAGPGPWSPALTADTSTASQKSRALASRGLRALERGDHDTAIQAFTAAATLAPESAEIHFHL